ncbi:MAG: hypothetical protein ACP5OA_04175 [Candidatus Woesearchaeota archaeon]
MIHMLSYEKELIQDIKDKKELRTLDEDFIKNKLEAFFKDKHHERAKETFLKKLESSKTYKQFTKSREYNFLIKEIRAELRKVYGVFIMDGYSSRKKLLEELRNVMSETAEIDESEVHRIHEKLFLLHKSTKERMDHYEELYTIIFDTIKSFSTGSVDNNKRYVCMDLACGMNPLSTVLFKDKIKKYYASDISTEDCAFLKEYFDITTIDAIIFPADLTDTKIFLKLEKIPVDICFIFKTLDGLERVHRNISEELLRCVNTKYFAITFPTLSIGGVREIKEHRRLWFEKLLERLGWKYEKFTLGSELLYVIEKLK